MKRFEKTEIGLKKEIGEIQIDPSLPFIEKVLFQISKWFSKNRKIILISSASFILIGGAVLIFVEYQRVQYLNSTYRLESIERKYPSAVTSLDIKLKELENLKKSSIGKLTIRIDKSMADLYVKEGKFKEAAKLYESGAKKISGYPELQSYFYYIAASNFEKSGDLISAEKDFELSSKMIPNKKELASFRVWAFYQTGRLKILNKKIKDGRDNLSKVFELEGSSPTDEISQAKKYATYILMTSNNK